MASKKAKRPVAVKPERDLLDVAKDALGSWYWQEVRDCADSVIERCKDEKVSYGDHGDILHEIVDSRACIIYTYQAWLVCAESKNDGAYEDEHGEPAPTIEARAFMALRADVEEMLSRREDEFQADSKAES